MGKRMKNYRMILYFLSITTLGAAFNLDAQPIFKDRLIKKLNQEKMLIKRAAQAAKKVVDSKPLTIQEGQDLQRVGLRVAAVVGALAAIGAGITATYLLVKKRKSMQDEETESSEESETSSLEESETSESEISSSEESDEESEEELPRSITPPPSDVQERTEKAWGIKLKPTEQPIVHPVQPRASGDPEFLKKLKEIRGRVQLEELEEESDEE